MYCVALVLLTQLVVPAHGIEPESHIEECHVVQTLEEELYSSLLQRKMAELQEDIGIMPLSLIPGSKNSKLLPSIGEVNILVIPITYSDHVRYAQSFDKEQTYGEFFSPLNLSDQNVYRQSVRGFYQWNSYGKLNIVGDVMDPYEAPQPSSYYYGTSDYYYGATDEQMSKGSKELLEGALKQYAAQGIDLSKYDNDGDGILDGIILKSLRPYSTHYTFKGYTTEADGYTVGPYIFMSMTIYGNTGEEAFERERHVAEHEIGHLLGLPDNYPKSSWSNVLDLRLAELMEGSVFYSGYINAYYKYLLGWIDPLVLTGEDGITDISLARVENYGADIEKTPRAVVFIPNSSAFPFSEFYLAEYRGGKMYEKGGSTPIYDDTPGIVLWHANTFITSQGSYTPDNESNYLKPVYKSGTEGYDTKDIYVAGDLFSSTTNPSSNFYDGTYTGIYMQVKEITADKAIIRAGFRNPDLSPVPIIEISPPSKKAIRRGESATVTITTKVGEELLSLDEASAQRLHGISISGEVIAGGVSWSASKNPMTVTIPRAWYPEHKDGMIWVDIPAGAIRYNGKDSAAVTSEKIYIDNTPPEITLKGADPYQVSKGTPYSDPGAIATDNLDPEIKGKLQIDSTQVNTDSPGTYTVTYSVTDHAGHTTTKERTVIVEESQSPHEHQFSASWENNESKHWHECECGEKADLADHKPEPIPDQAATCTQPGKTKGSRCSICGRTIVAQENIPPKEHTFSTSWNRDTSSHWRECTACQEKTELGSHTEDSGVITKKPTQEETGIKTYSCSVCGYVMRTEVLDKLDPSHTHSYPEQWGHDASNHWRECTTCHEKAEQAPHTWDSGTVTTAPTSSKAGEKTYTCTVCKRTRTETIPATGGGSSSGGGGGGSTPIPAEYKVTLPGKTVGGSVRASSVKAVKGTKITLSVEAEDGYEMEELKVRDKKGKEITLKEKEGKYTFSMPASDVEVIALFRELPKEELKEEPTPPPEKEPDPIVLPFTDVPEKAWYYDAVAEVYSRGIMTGLSETQFGPELPTSRGMVVTMLYRMEGQPAAQCSTRFTDVPEKQYYAPAVAWATEKGLVNGYGDNTFRPNAGITREQLVTILYRYAEQKGQDVAQRADLSGFFDASRISPYARESMSWAKAAGLLNGADWGGIDPGGAASRGQISVILTRFLRLMQNTGEAMQGG